MSCDEFELKMADYVTRRLDPEEMADVETHLDQCSGCRSYRDRIHGLYALDLDETVVLGAPRYPDLPGSRPRRTRYWWAAAVAAAAAAVVLYALLGHGGGSGEDSGEVRVALAPIQLEIPVVPEHYPGPGWIEDRTEAARLASYSGKTLLTTYSYGPCPHCKRMKKRFDSQRGIELVKDFIAHRVTFVATPPDDLKQHKTEIPLRFRMPAVVFSTKEKSSRPLFYLPSLDRLGEHIENWSRERKDSKKPPNSGQFERCLEILRDIPSRLESFDYELLLAALEEIISLEKDHRSRFVQDAKALRSALEKALRVQIKEISLAVAAGGRQKIEGLARARFLRQKLGESALGRELDRQVPN